MVLLAEGESSLQRHHPTGLEVSSKRKLCFMSYFTMQRHGSLGSKLDFQWWVGGLLLFYFYFFLNNIIFQHYDQILQINLQFLQKMTATTYFYYGSIQTTKISHHAATVQNTEQNSWYVPPFQLGRNILMPEHRPVATHEKSFLSLDAFVSYKKSCLECQCMSGRAP